ncbi:MAG: hypothetical protein ACRD51_03280 [Candidatus Acidiferrum sp.]
MTLTLKIKPELEARLLALAEARGMTVEQYLLSVVEGAVAPNASAAASPDERAAAFEAWARSHRPFAPPLSEDAVTREAMYGDH